MPHVCESFIRSHLKMTPGRLIAQPIYHCYKLFTSHLRKSVIIHNGSTRTCKTPNDVARSGLEMTTSIEALRQIYTLAKRGLNLLRRWRRPRRKYGIEDERGSLLIVLSSDQLLQNLECVWTISATTLYKVASSELLIFLRMVWHTVSYSEIGN